MSEYIILSIFLFLGAFIAAAATVTGLLLGYRTKKTKNKMAPYECGMETIGNARFSSRWATTCSPCFSSCLISKLCFFSLS